MSLLTFITADAHPHTHLLKAVMQTRPNYSELIFRNYTRHPNFTVCKIYS